MKLTPVKPDQEAIDGLILDAAWERARQLELELRQVRAMAKTTNDSYTRVLHREHRLESGILGLVMEYQSNPGEFGKTMADVMRELDKLIS